MIDTYKERFMGGQNKKERLSHHVDQIEKLLIPTSVTKMGLWTVEHTDDGEDSCRNMWSVIKQELQLSDEQVETLAVNRDKLVSMRANLQCTLSLLQEMRKRVCILPSGLVHCA